MLFIYFKCTKCDFMFLSGVRPELDKTMVCGAGCGGILEEISEEDAQLEVERIYGEREDY